MSETNPILVFLRVLEYYSGILFLTTNRIGVIDEAFKSRIHISLRYPSLDLASTRQIWENLLNRICRDNETQTVKVKFDKNELLAFAEAHFKEHEKEKRTWNGRQIRNAFQTAIALGRTDRIKMLKRRGLTEEKAEKKGKKGKEHYLWIHLTEANFKKIAQTAKDFEDFMVVVRGSDATTAKNESVRNDDYVPGVPRAEKIYQPIPTAVLSRGQAFSLKRPKSAASARSGDMQTQIPVPTTNNAAGNAKWGADDSDHSLSSSHDSDQSDRDCD